MTALFSSACSAACRRLLLAAVGLLALTMVIDAQTGSEARKASSDYIEPLNLPGVFQRYARSLGDRIKKPGNERLVLIGELGSGGKKDPIAATVELTGKVRVEYGAQKRTVVFDKGDAAALRLSQDTDQALIDTFAYDSGEALLYSVMQGALPRVLGFGFVSQQDHGAFGARLDIFELTQVIQSGSRDATLTKQFQFDTATGLLRRVSYRSFKGNTPVKVETEFSDYQTLPVGRVPKQIKRKEGGNVTLEIVLTSVQTSQKQNDNVFKP